MSTRSIYNGKEWEEGVGRWTVTRPDADSVLGILQGVLEGFEDVDAVIRDVKTEDIVKAFSDALKEETED